MEIQCVEKSKHRTCGSVNSYDSGFESHDFPSLQEELDHAHNHLDEPSVLENYSVQRRSSFREARKRLKSIKRKFKDCKSDHVDPTYATVKQIIETLSHNDRIIRNNFSRMQEATIEDSMPTNPSNLVANPCMTISTRERSSFRRSWRNFWNFLGLVGPIRKGVPYAEDVLLPPLSQFSQISSTKGICDFEQCEASPEIESKVRRCTVTKKITRNIGHLEVCCGALNQMIDESEEKTLKMHKKVTNLSSDLKNFAKYLRNFDKAKPKLY